MLQLCELGAREQDPPLMRAEVHEHGVIFHGEYDAEPVLVVRHLIADGERLGRARRSRGVERAAWQAAPGSEAGCLHNYHHAPSLPKAMGPAITVGRGCSISLTGLMRSVDQPELTSDRLRTPRPRQRHATGQWRTSGRSARGSGSSSSPGVPAVMSQMASRPPMTST